MDLTAAGEPSSELNLRLQMEPTYVLGLPFFVQITLSNETAGAEYYDLLPCDPFSPPFPVEFTFASGGSVTTLPARSSSAGSRRGGFDLLPGAARTFVLDLSELEPELTPGRWQCRARWVMRHERPQSESAEVTLVASEPADLPELTRLRLATSAQTPSWVNLVTSPDEREAVSVRGLSVRAARALVPYLILREAVHGPESLAAFPIEPLANQTQGPWASEASVLSYELRWARDSEDLTEQRVALLKRWPGVLFRLEQIEAGEGLLTALRQQYGPDRKDP